MNIVQLKRFALPLWQGLVELLYFSPIWLTIAIYSLPAALLVPYSLLLLLCYCMPRVIYFHRTQIRNGYRIAVDIILGLLPIIVLGAVHGELSLLAWIGCSLIGIIVVESSFRALLLGWSYSFNSTLMIFLLLAAIVLQVLKVMVLHQVAVYNPLFYSLGIIAMLLYLFIHNERTIKDQQMIEESSAAIRRSVVMNRWYISILALLVIGVASARNIQQMIEHYARGLLDKIIAWLSREGEVEQPPVEQPIAPPMDQMLDLGEKAEPSKFWVYLEMALKWLAITAIIVLVIVLVIYALRKVWPLLKTLLAQLLRLNMVQTSNDAGYTDIIEDIKHERLNEKDKKQKKNRLSAKKQWGQLSAGEKIRYLYRMSVEYGTRSGKQMIPSLTAMETIQLLKQDEADDTNVAYDQLLRRYHETRYGQIEPQEAEVESLRSELDRAHKKS